MGDSDFQKALKEVLMEHKVSYQLKAKQIDSIRMLCSGNHVFTVLPTGYGKSDVFVWAPLVQSKLSHEHKFSLVISPLISLMRDQVSRWTSAGVNCAALHHGSDPKGIVKQGILTRQYSVIFTSPEAAVDPEIFTIWEQVKESVATIAFDEAHCMIQWGKTFREQYINVRRVRSVLEKVPVCMLTATTTEAMKEEIKLILGLTDVIDVVAVPDRPNVHLTIKSEQCHAAVDLHWYIQELILKGNETPKAIIFCRSIDAVTKLYGEIIEQVEGKCDCSKIEIFHCHVDPESLEDVLSEFAMHNSHIRCLISTIAFGMGMQVDDIDYVLHWGPPQSILDYWQEVGRCARSIHTGKALLYTPPYSLNTRTVDKDMINLVKTSSEVCIRKQVLQSLNLKQITQSDIEKCCGGEKCCNFCDNVQSK